MSAREFRGDVNLKAGSNEGVSEERGQIRKNRKKYLARDDSLDLPGLLALNLVKREIINDGGNCAQCSCRFVHRRFDD